MYKYRFNIIYLWYLLFNYQLRIRSLIRSLVQKEYVIPQREVWCNPHQADMFVIHVCYSLHQHSAIPSLLVIFREFFWCLFDYLNFRNVELVFWITNRWLYIWVDITLISHTLPESSGAGGRGIFLFWGLLLTKVYNLPGIT